MKLFQVGLTGIGLLFAMNLCAQSSKPETSKAVVPHPTKIAKVHKAPKVLAPVPVLPDMDKEMEVPMPPPPPSATPSLQLPVPPPPPPPPPVPSKTKVAEGK